MAAVVLVVRDEDGEGLRSGHAGVVGTLSRLDGLGDLGCCHANQPFCPSTILKYPALMPAHHSPEQLVDDGFFPFVLEVAGSRVARTMAGAASREKKLVKCILADVELVSLVSRSWIRVV